MTAKGVQRERFSVKGGCGVDPKRQDSILDDDELDHFLTSLPAVVDEA